MAGGTVLPLDQWEREIARLSEVPFERGDRPYEMARAQALVEQILEGYARASESDRQQLRALYSRYPRFLVTAERVLWRTPDPLATARLHLLFYSLTYYDHPEWAATVDHVVKEALRATPPVDRKFLAALLRWVANLSEPKPTGEGKAPAREFFEHLAAEQLREAGREGSGGASG